MLFFPNRSLLLRVLVALQKKKREERTQNDDEAWSDGPARGPAQEVPQFVAAAGFTCTSLLFNVLRLKAGFLVFAAARALGDFTARGRF